LRQAKKKKKGKKGGENCTVKPGQKWWSQRKGKDIGKRSGGGVKPTNGSKREIKKKTSESSKDA